MSCPNPLTCRCSERARMSTNHGPSVRLEWSVGRDDVWTLGPEGRADHDDQVSAWVAQRLPASARAEARADLGDPIIADRLHPLEEDDCGCIIGQEHTCDDGLIPSIVDGPIRPENMCLGSENRQVMFCGDRLQCSTCQRWLPAYPGSFLAPVHATVDPKTEVCYTCYVRFPVGETCPSCLPVGTKCHAECGLCWNDFVLDHPTDHACACDVCVPWHVHDGLLNDGGCEECWLESK